MIKVRHQKFSKMKNNPWINFFLYNSRWKALLSLLCLIAIMLYFFLQHFFPQFSNFPLFVIIAVGGVPLLTQIAIKVLNKNLGADLLAFIALIVAVCLQEYLASVLIILMLASGQALEEYATRKASFVLENLAKRIPNLAHLKREKNVEDVSVEKIKIGDLLEIYPHEICPIDGIVVEGFGSMDESYLTGEPYKISKASGSAVLSGAINGESLLVIRATKLAQDSRYAQIIEVMQEAQQQRPNLRRLGDQIGAIFAPIALAIAFATLIFSGSLVKFLAVLVVATPCPLLIAIPITIISAISISASHGIIIKDPTVLERLPVCTTAIFDKTGTLTCGDPELTDVILLQDFSRSEVLKMAASLERYSRHPLANAILKAAKKENIILADAENVLEKPGQGLTGKIADHEVFVTSRKKISADHPNLPNLEHGLECVIVIDKKPAALLHFRDMPRAESNSFIGHLAPNHNFKKIILLSGDRSSEVNYLANLLGIKDTYAGQTPEQKVEIVKQEAAKAPTIFIGDGINDAPALMVATVGIAFGSNSGVTSESAGAVILENNLSKVDKLIHISNSMRKIALQSAVGGMLLSLIGIGFAVAGMITPVTGALLQELIDVAAILNALRLTWQSEIDSDM